MDKFNKAYNRILHLISESSEDPIDAYDEQKFIEKDNANKWLRANRPDDDSSNSSDDFVADERIEELTESCPIKMVELKCPRCHGTIRRNDIDTSGIESEKDKELVRKNYLSKMPKYDRDRIESGLCRYCYEKAQNAKSYKPFHKEEDNSIYGRGRTGGFYDDDSDDEM